MLLHTLPCGLRVYAAQLPPPAPGVRHDLAAERAAVRSLIAEAFAPAPPPQLIHAPSGAPALAESAATISITHSRAMAAIAIDPLGRPLGIDTDTPGRETTLRRVAPRFLSPEQLPSWSATPELFLTAWALKEALYKALLTPGIDFTAIPLPPPELLASNPTVTHLGATYTLHLLPTIAHCGPLALALRTQEAEK